MEFFRQLFESTYMPHGHCYMWRTDLLWLHAVSDILIASAYYAIPIALIYFVAKRRDFAFKRIFVLFGAFILLCGTTHVLEVWSIWNATYYLTGSVKLLTGVVSAATAFMLVPLLPKALALPSPAQLSDANAALRREIEAREKAEEELRALNAELESRVAERTRELAQTNTDLQRQIAERERAEAALRREQELLEKLFDRIPVMLTIWDSEIEVLRLNSEMERVLGFTMEDADDLVELTYPDPDYREDVLAYMQSLEPGWRDFEMVTKDGERVLASWSNIILSDNTRVGIGIDITERKRLEDQATFLAEAGAVLSTSLNYEETLQAVTDLVVPRLADWCVIHAETRDGDIAAVALAHSDPEKVQWARELQERYPFDRTASQGAPSVLRTGKPEHYPEIPDHLLVQIARDEHHLEMLRKVGFRSALAVPLEARGQVLGVLTMIWSETPRHYTARDLEFAEQLARRAALSVDNARLYSEAQQAHRELERLNASLEERVEDRTAALADMNEELRSEIAEREAAERALGQVNRTLLQRNRELQDFAYVASHDLKEPLRKVQTFGAMMLSEYGEQLDDNAHHYLDRMRSAAGRMSSLIDDLLAFSRVTTQGETFREVDLDALAQDVIHDLEVQIAESNARIKLDPLPTIEADPTQMQQLLQNLISNALKFRRKGIAPDIRVEASAGSDGMMRLTVEDNGIGFDERFVERIFAPFQRLHGKSEFEGTGIGLAICRRIVERHGGTITAASRPGQGSTFTVELPLKQK